MADRTLDAYASRARLEPFTEHDQPSVWTDTVAAAFAFQRREENSDSAHIAIADRINERAKKIGELGGDERLARSYPQDFGLMSRFRRLELEGRLQGNAMYTANPAIAAAYDHVRAFEKRFPGVVLDDEGLTAETAAKYSKLRAADQDTIDRGGGFAAFAGQAGGSMTDPMVLMTLPIGGELAGPGKTVLGTIGRTAASEGAISMLTEIPIQAQVADFKRSIGAPWSDADSAMNVLAAGAGGALLGGTLSAAGLGYKGALAKYREAKAAGKIRQTAEMDEAEEALADAVDFQEQNPLKQDAGIEEFSVDAHARALETATAQLDNGQPVDVAGIVAGHEAPDPVGEVITRSQDPAALIDVDPLTLQVDAKTFQFKGGSDAEGVTSTLRDVDRFDRRLAGVALIWERADGQQFIADGHQRLALARRAIAAGQDPGEVRLNGFLLREADGVTAADARRMAAVKNMAEGSGSSLDAAKILRDVGPAGEALLPPLPPRSALVRQARGLAALGEDEFLQVVNGVVDERMGALVGAAAADPKLQSAMIEVLRRAQPANEVQARGIIEQVRTQGLETRTTEDLFGEASFSESLYLERAQVLDSALKLARDDKVVFGGLVRNEERIATAGENRLDRAANLARQQEATDAAQQITIRANTKGALSDALTVAARQVREGAKPGTVAKAFLAAARREILQGDSGRGAAGAAGRASDPSRIVAAEVSLKDIDARDLPELAGLSHNPTDYVEATSSSVSVRLEQLAPGKVTTQASSDNAVKRFAAAAAGEIKKRKPISIGVNEAGQLYVVDGNGTVAALRRMGVTEVQAELEIPLGKPIELQRLAPRDREVVKAAFKSRQAGQTIEQLYQVAPAHQAKLAKSGEAIAAELGEDVKFLDPGVKARATSEEKIGRKGYDDAGGLEDVIRVGFIARVPELSRQILERLAQKFELMDEGVTVTGLGYLDHKAKVRFPDGRVAEIQIWDEAMLLAKQGPGHDLYKEMRAMTPEEAMTPEGKAKADAVTEASKDLYAGAIAAGDPEWRRLAMMALPEDMRVRVQAALEAGGGGNGAGSGGVLGNISKKAERVSSEPDSKTSIGTTRDQAPAPKLQTKASSPPADAPRTTAARPSQLKNRSAIDSPPRSIIHAVDDPKSAQPTKTRTGTVEDADYDAVMSQYQDLSEQRGALLKVTHEIDGVLTERQAAAVIDELDTLEESLERVRLCSVPARAA